MAEHNSLGNWGERIATDFLISKGYAIVETNYRIAYHEIDIIATIGSRIAFIEVKTRSTGFVDPAVAVNSQRIKRMTAAANSYLRDHDIPHDPQFDIITIIGTPQHYELQHIPDAFRPPLRTR